MIKEILEVPFNRGTNIALSLFGCIVAPYWYSFNFIPEIVRLELIPSLLVCIAISLPIMLVYYLFCYTLNLIVNKEELKNTPLGADDVFDLTALAAILTSVGFYIPCISLYFIKFTRGCAINITFGINIALIALSFCMIFMAKKMLSFSSKEDHGKS